MSLANMSFYFQIKKHLKSPNFVFMLLSSLVIWACTAVVIGLMYMLIAQSIWNGLEDELETQVTEFKALVEADPLADYQDLVYRMLNQPELSVIHPVDAGHQYLDSLQAQSDMMQTQKGLSRAPQHIRDHLHILEGSSGSRLISNNLILEDGTVIQFSKRIDYINSLELQLLRVLLYGLLATFFIACAGSVLLTRLSMKRINLYNRTCQEIIAGDMTSRIHVHKIRDEYDRLAITINHMLDRISQLMKGIRQVSDNIAHELRSPLSRMRARLESYNKDRQSDELTDSIMDLDRVLDMSSRLLNISKLENTSSLATQRIDVKTLLEDLVELYLPLAMEEGQNLQSDLEPGVIAGDQNLIFQALSNVIDNSIKFTPEGGSIIMRSRREKHRYLIEIRDTGPGVDPEQIQRLFERFHRVDEARSKPGFGLGLSLVQAIVRLHGGEVKLENREGLCVTIDLPLLPR